MSTSVGLDLEKERDQPARTQNLFKLAHGKKRRQGHVKHQEICQHFLFFHAGNLLKPPGQVVAVEQPIKDFFQKGKSDDQQAAQERLAQDGEDERASRPCPAEAQPVAKQDDLGQDGRLNQGIAVVIVGEVVLLQHQTLIDCKRAEKSGQIDE